MIAQSAERQFYSRTLWTSTFYRQYYVIWWSFFKALSDFSSNKKLSIQIRARNNSIFTYIGKIKIALFILVWATASHEPLRSNKLYVIFLPKDITRAKKQMTVHQGYRCSRTWSYFLQASSTYWYMRAPCNKFIRILFIVHISSVSLSIKQVWHPSVFFGKSEL